MKTKTLKTLFSYFPEFSFFSAAIYWFLDTYIGTSGEVINYGGLGVLLFLALLLWSKKSLVAVIVAFLFGIGSFYFLLGVVSDIAKDSVLLNDNLILYIVAPPFLLFLIGMAVLMPFKYLFKGRENDEIVV